LLYLSNFIKNMRHFTYTPSKKLAKDISNTNIEEEKKSQIVSNNISPFRPKREGLETEYNENTMKTPDSQFKYVPQKTVEKDPDDVICPTTERLHSYNQTEENKNPIETAMSMQNDNEKKTPVRSRSGSGEYTSPEHDIAPTASVDTPKIAKRLRIEIKWENVKVWPKSNNGCCSTNDSSDQYILNNVSGAVRHGQFLSLMGTSGAGKTTLLQFLSNKMFPSSLECSGSVTINKKKRETLNYDQFTAFVQQDDILMDMMTIRECVEFAADLRCPGTAKRRHERVNETLDELELRNIEDLKVGDPMVGKYFFTHLFLLEVIKNVLQLLLN